MVELTEESLIKDMKKWIKKNQTTSKCLKKMVNDGIDEDTAIDVMLYYFFLKTKQNYLNIEM